MFVDISVSDKVQHQGGISAPVVSFCTPGLQLGPAVPFSAFRVIIPTVSSVIFKQGLNQRENAISIHLVFANNSCRREIQMVMGIVYMVIYG